MNSWVTVRLGDVCVLNYGKSLTATNRKAGVIPVYSSAGITGWHNEPLINSEGIIIGRKGTVGSVYHSKEPFYCIDTAYYILPDKAYDFKYLYYRLKSLGLEKLNEDSAVPGLNRETAYSQEFLLPSLEEQGRIAGILGALDDKIECNNRINRNLEEQAAVLFRRWFVDFEFPDPDPTSPTYAKPYRSAGGKMQDSPLGPIPKGWQVGKASDYFNISIGKTPPRAESHWFSRDNKDVIWVSIANMGNSGVYINDSSEYLTSESIKKFNIVLVPSNTVILSFKLTVGRVAITNGITTTNEAIAHFKTENAEITEYLYLLLKTYDYQSMGSTSSIATAVNSKMVKAMTIMMPSTETLGMFHKVISPIFEKLKANQTENQTLVTLRDTLLPKLMNNEI